MPAPLETAAVLAAVLVASAVQSLLGFGFALVTVPLVMGVVGVRDAVVLVTFAGVVNTALVAHDARGTIAWRRVAVLLAGSLAGLPVGLAVLLRVPEDALRVAVGTTTAVTAVVMASGVRPLEPGIARDLGVGFLSGVLNTATGMNGPPVVLYLQALRTRPGPFRGMLAAFFTVTSAATVVVFVATGVASRRATGLALMSLPLVLAGNAVGRAAARRVDPGLFRRLVLALLVVTGAVAAASALLRPGG